MGRSLKLIAILSIIALVISSLSTFLFFIFGFLRLTPIFGAVAGIIIFSGYAMISKINNNKLLKISSRSLIVLAIIGIALTLASLISSEGVFFNLFGIFTRILWALIVIFLILLGIGIINLRHSYGVFAIITGILFILSAMSLGLSRVIFGLRGVSALSSIISFESLTVVFSIILFFIADSIQTGSTTIPEGQSPGKLIAKGYGISTLIALIVAVLGALFEAVILLPVFGFVTFTLGPDILFVIVNLIYLFIAKDKYTKIGIAIGFLNIILVIIVSFIVFLITIFLVPSLGRGLGF